MAIIFDLDQTLIDSSAAEHLRSNRQWGTVYGMIPTLTPYEGIPELLRELEKRSIPYGIVTSSPSSYCNRVLQHWGWNTSFMVCYHDTQRRKPYPDPINLAIQKSGASSNTIISVGDDARDIEASKQAGVASVGVLWGAKDHHKLVGSKPDYLLHSVAELTKLIEYKYF